MPRSHRRVLAAAIGLVTVAAAAIACKPPPTRPPDTVPRSTSTTIDSVPGAIDCGVINYTSGAPTTRLVVIASEGKCLIDAFGTGRPARLITKNGAEKYGNATFDVLGVGRLRVVTPVAGLPDGLLVQECRNLGTSVSYLQPGQCTAVPPAAPPLAGTDCGTLAYANGWPTTPPIRLTNCFPDAWAAGTPARLVTRDQTDGNGGAILVVTYDILGRGQLRVITDTRQTVTPGPIRVEFCAQLTFEGNRLRPAACDLAPPTPGTAPPTAVTTGTTGSPGTTGTPGTTGAPGGPLDCGTISYAAGWPTTFYVDLGHYPPGVCFLTAWEKGTPARLVTREQTDGRGGGIRVVTYEILSKDQLRVATGAATGGAVTTERCTGLTHDRSYLHPEGCTPV